MNYDQQMDKILQCRKKDFDQFFQLIQDMRKALKKDTDLNKEELTRYRIFTDIYLCESYILIGKMKEAVTLGEKVLKKLLRQGNEESLPLLYNLLGYAYGCMDNCVGASTFFCEGIEIATKQDDYDMLRILYCNFAISYINLEQYEKAKLLIDKSQEMFDHLSLPEEEIEIAFRNSAELLSAYYFGICDYEQGIRIFDIHNETHRVKINEIQYMVKSAIYNFETGNKCKTMQILSDLMQSDPVIQNPVNQYDIYVDLLNLAMKLKHHVFTDFCLKKIQDSARKCDIPNYWVCYYEYQIQVCELFGKEPDNSLYERFYHYHQEISSQREKNEGTYLINELEIFKGNRKQKELEKKNTQLIQISMIDQLTKVYNRAGFQMQFSSLFSSALGRQVPLGFCMIDLDYFKEVNDHFGHLAGDNCLKIVAKTIHSCFGKESVVCRYGGDEFVVITLDFTDEKMKKSLQKLIHHKKLKSIVEKDSVKKEITLSIGAINCIPQTQSAETDYIYTADNLLHQVKTESKNGYRFETKLN